MRFHRFELAFCDEPQNIGFMQGLEDVGLPIELESELHQPFDDELESPVIRSITHEQVEFWFTEAGYQKFLPHILKIAAAIAQHNDDWCLLYGTMDADVSTAVYSDQYQAAWPISVLNTDNSTFKEVLLNGGTS